MNLKSSACIVEASEQLWWKHFFCISSRKILHDWQMELEISVVTFVWHISDFKGQVKLPFFSRERSAIFLCPKPKKVYTNIVASLFSLFFQFQFGHEIKVCQKTYFRVLQIKTRLVFAAKFSDNSCQHEFTITWLQKGHFVSARAVPMVYFCVIKHLSDRSFSLSLNLRMGTEFFIVSLTT